jgi:hypothetical protein
VSDKGSKIASDLSISGLVHLHRKDGVNLTKDFLQQRITDSVDIRQVLVDCIEQEVLE